MSKTQIIDLVKKIKKTFVSYLSVIIFVAMGTCVFCSFGWTGQAFKNSIEQTFTVSSFRDYEIVFPYGVSDSDIERLKAVSGVSEAEGYFKSYGYTDIDGTIYHVDINSITENIDRINVVKGKLPTGEGEIAIGEIWAEKIGLKLGDEMVFNHDDSGNSYLFSAVYEKDESALSNLGETYEGMKYLTCDTFKVTAFIESPAFASIYSFTYGVSPDTSSPIDFYAFVSEKSFDKKAFCGYGRAILTADSLRAYATGSDEYAEYSQKLTNGILSVANDISHQKSQTLNESASDLHLSFSFPQLDVSIFSRIENGGYVSSKTVYVLFDGLRYSMALLFVIIGLLVSYTAVSRMVYEDKKQIGTKKALGFNDSSITLSYLLYSGTAAVIGTVFGIILARFCLEPLIMVMMFQNYTYSERVFVFSIVDCLLVFVVEFGLSALSAFIASKKILAMNSVVLLSDGDGRKFKNRFYEKLRFWKRCSILTKTIINNFFTDKRRVISTIIGIMGCASLVVCGITLSNNIGKGFDKHYSEIQTYDTVVYFDNGVSDSEAEISNKLDGLGVTYGNAFGSMGRVKSDKFIMTSYLWVFDEKDLKGLFNVRAADGENTTYENKVWLCASFADKSNLKVGDRFTYYSCEGKPYTLTVGGIMEYYLLRCQVVMSRGTYQTFFGETPKNNMTLFDKGDLSIRSVTSAVKNVDGFVQVEDFYTTSIQACSVLANTSTALAYIYLVLSVILSILVLLNLFTVFVSEKKRELITLRVVGFYERETKKYIYSDIIVLTVIGIILGLVLGSVMGIITTKSLASECIYLIYDVNLVACLIGVGFTAALSFVMTVLALRKIKKFSLTEVDK